MDWYLKVLKQYFDFSGRARRKEYWMFALISMIISIVLTLLDMGVGLYSELYGAGLLSSIYSLAIVIYGPTRFASDFEALINKFIAFIYPACEPGVLYTRSPNAIS